MDSSVFEYIPAATKKSAVVRFFVKHNDKGIGFIEKDKENKGWKATLGKLKDHGKTQEEAAEKLVGLAQQGMPDEHGFFTAFCDGCSKVKRVKNKDNTHFNVCVECATQPFWI